MSSTFRSVQNNSFVLIPICFNKYGGHVSLESGANTKAGVKFLSSEENLYKEKSIIKFSQPSEKLCSKGNLNPKELKSLFFIVFFSTDTKI